MTGDSETFFLEAVVVVVYKGYTDLDFQADKDSRKSTLGVVFTINGGVVVWKSIKQSCIADSTMEAEYVVACEATKKAEHRSHKRSKHIERKYHFIGEIVQSGDVFVDKISPMNNLANLFTKPYECRPP